MRRALYLPNFGPLGSVDAVRELASAGGDWDGFFVWDHLTATDGTTGVEDVWTLLRQVAETSERLLLGPMIAALGRTDAASVARAAAELESIAPGRVVVGFGAGVRADLEWAGEQMTPKELRERVESRADELRAHLVAAGADIPLWASGLWPRKTTFPGGGAASGVFPIRDVGERRYGPPLPQDVAAIRARLGGDGLVAFTGRSGSGDGEGTLEQYERMGLDWWLEDLYGSSLADALATARRGLGSHALGDESLGA